jgi:hypothetical protein
MAEAGFPELIKRLDAVIGLLVVTLPQSEQPRSLRDQIKLLDAAGLAPVEIGRIVGKPGKDVNSELAKIRAAKKGDKSRRKGVADAK